MNSKSAFSLVELTIVIAILGILAAVVIPRFSTATDNARSTGALSQLVTLRKQMEVWKLEHNDLLPTLSQLQNGASDWGVFTSKTQLDGALNASGEFGPYIPTPPMNPYTNSTLVVEAGSATTSAGWTYNEETGVLKMVLPASVETAGTDLTAGDFERP